MTKYLWYTEGLRINQLFACGYHATLILHCIYTALCFLDRILFGSTTHSFITACLARASVPFGFCFCCIRSGAAVSKRQLITQFLVPFGSCYCTSNSPLGRAAFYGVVSLNSAVCTRRQGNFLSTFLFGCFSNHFHGSVERTLKKLYHIFKGLFFFLKSLLYCATIPLTHLLYQPFMLQCPIVGIEITSKYWSLLGILWELVSWQFEIHFFTNQLCGSTLTYSSSGRQKDPISRGSPDLLQDAFVR